MAFFFRKLVSILRSHLFIIISAAVMALLIVSPAILFPIMSGANYRGINIGNFDQDDIGYFSKGREILDGNHLGNYYLNVGKEGDDPHRVYVEYVLLAPIKLLGLSQTIDLVVLYNVYNFVGIFILILLIYCFVLRLSGHKLLSAAASLFVVGGYTFVILYPILVGLSYDFNVYGRPTMPIFSSLAFFIFLNLLTKCLESEKDKNIILAGLSLGSLFYVYFYAWTFALIFIGSLFLLHVIKRDVKQIKKILAIVGIGIATGSYVLVKMFLFFRSDIGKQSSYFLSLHTSHSFGPISKLSVLALLLFLIYSYKKRNDRNNLLILAFIVAGWIAMNQQVITGKSVQPLHYFWYFIIPTVIIVGFYMLWLLVDDARFGWYKKIALIILIMAAFTNTAVRQYRGASTTKNILQYGQNYRVIFDALNLDKNPGVVLSSEDFFSRYLTVYTHHDMFWSQAGAFNTPLQRFKDALFVTCYLNKKSRNNFVTYVTSNSGITGPIAGSIYEHAEQCQEIYNTLISYLSGTLDGGEYAYKMAIHDPIMEKKTEEATKRLNEEYKAAISKPHDVVDILVRGGVNYVIWDKNKNPDWDLSAIPDLHEVIFNNNIYLYKFNVATK